MDRPFFLLVLMCGVLSGVLQGCAAVAPFASALPGLSPGANIAIHSETSVKLQEGNFVTVRTNVVGQSKGFKLLGFITIVPATLDTAMNRLYAQAEAQDGRPQTLAHLIVEHSGVNVILFSIPKVTARADLIEFLPREQDDDSFPESMSADGGS